MKPNLFGDNPMGFSFRALLYGWLARFAAAVVDAARQLDGALFPKATPVQRRPRFPGTPSPDAVAARFDNATRQLVDFAPVAAKANRKRVVEAAQASDRRAVWLSTDGGLSWHIVPPTDPRSRSLRPAKAGRPVALLSPSLLVPPDGVDPRWN